MKYISLSGKLIEKHTSDKKSSIDSPPIAFRSAESLYGGSFQGLEFQRKCCIRN